jgi:predicted O-methyltransferase YrrM
MGTSSIDVVTVSITITMSGTISRGRIRMSRLVDHPEEYFARLTADRDEILLRLEREAEEETIPIVGPVVGRFLEILVRAVGARRVLELGCATGYSAIFLARGLTGGVGKVLTVENNPERAVRARENFAAAGLSGAVELLEGDGAGILEGIVETVDLIFLDVEKEAYVQVFPHCRRLLRPGGLLVADNTAFRDAVPFVEAVSKEEGWQAVHFFSYLPGHSPERDGLTIAQKIT